MNNVARNINKLFSFIYVFLLLFISSCGVDLEVPDDTYILHFDSYITVEVLYTQDHESVIKTLSVDRISFDYSRSSEEWSCSETPDVQQQTDAPAVQATTGVFNTISGLCPGKLLITVSAFDEEGTSLFPGGGAYCEIDTVEIAEDTKSTDILVRFIEGQVNCTGDTSELPLPIRNVSVDEFLSPPAIGQGDVIDINVTYRNTGNTNANTTLKFKVKPETVACNMSDINLDGELPVLGLAAGTHLTHIFTWDTASVSPGSYNICTWLDHLAGSPSEIDLDDNLKTVVVDVALRSLVLQNLTVLPVTEPVILGQIKPVQVDVINNGGVDETITIELEDTRPDGVTVTLASTSIGPLAANGGSQTVGFTFDTSVTGFVAGQHRLTAKITAPVIVSTSYDVFVEKHEAAIRAGSVNPQTLNANIGDVISGSLIIDNNGILPTGVNENVELELTAQVAGSSPIVVDQKNIVLNPGANTINFNWNTFCYPAAGGYTLTASITVENDDDLSNNMRSSVSPVTLNYLHNQLSVNITSNPANAVIGEIATYEFQITNGNSVAESDVGLVFTDTDGGGPAFIPGAYQFIQDGPNSDTAPPFNLACGETKTSSFIWGPSTISSPGEIHILQLQIPARLGSPGPISTDNISVILQ